jgi:hypothetical protein
MNPSFMLALLQKGVAHQSARNSERGRLRHISHLFGASQVSDRPACWTKSCNCAASASLLGVAGIWDNGNQVPELILLKACRWRQIFIVRRPLLQLTPLSARGARVIGPRSHDTELVDCDMPTSDLTA